jgi:hypothetical protein
MALGSGVADHPSPLREGRTWAGSSANGSSTNVEDVDNFVCKLVAKQCDMHHKGAKK